MQTQERLQEMQETGHLDGSRTSKDGPSLVGVLLCTIFVLIVSLFISLPLLAYLEDRLALSSAGSSELITLLVCAIGAFSTGWFFALLRRVFKGGDIGAIFRNYFTAFFLFNGVTALVLSVVIALRHHLDISVVFFLLAVSAGFSAGSSLLFSALNFMVSWISRWPGNLRFFEKAALDSFDFLGKRAGYSKPRVEAARNFYVVFERPSENLAFTVGWERGTLTPSISFWVVKPEGRMTIALQDVLEKLDVGVDLSAFPLCENLTIEAGWVHIPGVLSQLRRKGEVERFLHAHAKAFQANHDAVLEEVRKHCG